MPPWISATSSSKGRSVMYGRDVALGDVDLAHDQVHVGVDVREELQRPLPLRRERLLVARGDDRVEADDARVELLAVRLVLLERAHEGPHVGEDGPERVVGVAVPLAERGELVLAELRREPGERVFELLRVGRHGLLQVVDVLDGRRREALVADLVDAADRLRLLRDQQPDALELGHDGFGDRRRELARVGPAARRRDLDGPRLARVAPLHLLEPGLDGVDARHEVVDEALVRALAVLGLGVQGARDLLDGVEAHVQRQHGLALLLELAVVDLDGRRRLLQLGLDELVERVRQEGDALLEHLRQGQLDGQPAHGRPAHAEARV